MTEVAGRHRDLAADIGAGVVPGLHAPHHHAVPQVVHARRAVRARIERAWKDLADLAGPFGDEQTPLAQAEPSGTGLDRCRQSAAIVVRPVRRAACGNCVVEYLVLVGGPGHAVLAGCPAILFPGAEQELIGPAPVARSPGIAAALFGIADADADRRVSSVAARLRRR